MAELRKRKDGAGVANDVAADAAEVKVKAAPYSDVVTRNERFVPWVIALVAFVSRFYRLDQPPGVVFDESHFGKFTGWYTKHQYYFDIHPPLAKLTLWAWGVVVGYDPDKCSYENISEQYGPGCKYVFLRAVAAAFSVGTIVLMYHITRRWGGSAWGGILASGLLITDMLNLIESRLILLDSQLSFWCTAALFVGTTWFQALNRDADADDAGDAGKKMSLRERAVRAIGLGVVCGNAFSVKMTGLATPAAIGFEALFAVFFLRRAAPLFDCVLVLLAGFATFFWWYRVHYWVLTKWSIQTEEFETEQFQRTMVGGPKYDPSAVWEGFWYTAVKLNRRMIVHNAAILAPHHWQSKWYEWLLNQRGVSYYGRDAAHGYSTHIYLIGNHALHYGVLGAWAAVAASAVLFVRYRNDWSIGPGLARFKPFFAQAAFCFMVYAINLAPYVGVARSTFIYHYMPALIYGELMVARLAESVVGPRYTKYVAAALLAATGGVVLFFAPWIYGTPLTLEGHARRRWLPRWD